jgi:ankyrin repeat protein
MKYYFSLAKLARGSWAVLAFALLACLGIGSAGAQSLQESWRAALAGDLPTVQNLVERGTSPDTSDAEGSTLLMLAARGGHTPVVSYLISRKASVNGRNKFGDTALMAAAMGGHVETAKVLIANGAELNGSGWTPLHYAAFEGRAPMVKFLLEAGADKNAVAPNEFTPLMLAVRNGQEEAAKVLLYGDPDVNYKTRSGGETALKLAQQKGYEPVVVLLKRAGAVE